MKYIFLPLLFLTFFIASCGTTQDPHNHDETEDTHAEEEGHEEEEVGFNTVQMEKIGMELGSYELKNLSATIKVNGVLEIPPQNKASVGTFLSGQVQRIHVRPGQFIKKGGLLATIQNTQLIEWQEQLVEAEGKLMYLTQEYDRQKQLLEKEIAAKKQFEKTASELKITQAHQKALKSKLRMVGINPSKLGEDFTSVIGIRSPFGGFVSNIAINTGSYVENNQTLFEIVDNHHIHIDLKVFEKDLPHLAIGQKIDFSLQSNPSKVMQASIFALGKAMNTEDRTVTVHAEIDNKTNELLPGMYVEARIITENQEVMAVPESAITVDKGLSFIFVREEAHEEADDHAEGHDDDHGDEVHFKKIQVLLGAQDIGFVEITPLEDVSESDQIVLKGAYFLMAQSKKDEGGGGHHH